MTLWELIEPLLPPPSARTGTRGRPRLSDRAALTGILFVLRSGLPWELLSQEVGCGSGMTCWRRLRVRDEERDDIHEAPVHLANAMICWGRLNGHFC
jgi:transposase